MCVLSRWVSANRTLIPVRCRIVKDMEHFDGAWTVRSTLYSSDRLSWRVTLDVGK